MHDWLCTNADGVMVDVIRWIWLPLFAPVPPGGFVVDGRWSMVEVATEGVLTTSVPIRTMSKLTWTGGVYIRDLVYEIQHHTARWTDTRIRLDPSSSS